MTQMEQAKHAIKGSKIENIYIVIKTKPQN
jgi:hypothetical protein